MRRLWDGSVPKIATRRSGKFIPKAEAPKQAPGTDGFLRGIWPGNRESDIRV